MYQCDDSEHLRNQGTREDLLVPLVTTLSPSGMAGVPFHFYVIMFRLYMLFLLCQDQSNNLKMLVVLCYISNGVLC